MTYDHWQRLAELAQSETVATIVMPGNILVQAGAAKLTLSRTRSA